MSTGSQECLWPRGPRASPSALHATDRCHKSSSVQVFCPSPQLNSELLPAAAVRLGSAPTVRATSPCLFVLRDWKWRRAETKAITWVSRRSAQSPRRREQLRAIPGLTYDLLLPTVYDLSAGGAETGFTKRRFVVFLII